MMTDLAQIQYAIGVLRRYGLQIDSFTVDLGKMTEVDKLAIAAKHLGAIDPTAQTVPGFPRTLAGIPVNVKR